MKFNERLKEIRKEKGLRQKDLTLWTDDSRSDGFVKEKIKRQIPKVDYILN